MFAEMERIVNEEWEIRDLISNDEAKTTVMESAEGVIKEALKIVEMKDGSTTPVGKKGINNGEPDERKMPAQFVAY